MGHNTPTAHTSDISRVLYGESLLPPLLGGRTEGRRTSPVDGWSTIVYCGTRKEGRTIGSSEASYVGRTYRRETGYTPTSPSSMSSPGLLSVMTCPIEVWGR